MQYGLIGEKLGYSFSKEIHESFAPYTYEPFEIKREELPLFLQNRDFCALNVTIPYKKEVIPFLDEISEQAKELQSVNTVVNKNGRLFGYNTDYFGLKDTVLRSKIDLKGKKILILGTGATARTAHLVCRNLGARDILLVSRSIKDGAVSYAEAQTIHNDADVIINATPVGTLGTGGSPISLDSFSRLIAVFDAVYNPLRTPLVLDARARGIYAEGGLYMLVSQAVRASALFLGEDADTDKIEKIYKNILKSKENIVLVGMPGAGKTTVGEMLANELSRPLISLDDEAENRLGTTIAECFDAQGEQAFRNIEAELTRELSEKSGVIISTGGGTVLREDNVRALKSNGRLYFIDRSPSKLVPTESRPLARTRIDLERLYKSRYHIYCGVSDVTVNGDCTPENVCSQIREDFET